MAVFTRKQCHAFIYHYFLRRGWLPPGTTHHNWRDVTIEMLHLDNPPFANDPHYQKNKVALDIQDHFLTFGGGIESPLNLLSKPELNLIQIGDWCFEHQVG